MGFSLLYSHFSCALASLFHLFPTRPFFLQEESVSAITAHSLCSCDTAIQYVQVAPKRNSSAILTFRLTATGARVGRILSVSLICWNKDDVFCVFVCPCQIAFSPPLLYCRSIFRSLFQCVPSDVSLFHEPYHK